MEFARSRRIRPMAIFRRPWHGMRELEGVPRQECEELLHEALDTSPWIESAYFASLILTFLGSLFFALVPLGPFIDSISPPLPGGVGARLAFLLFVGSVGVLAPTMGVLVARDRWRGRLLQHHMNSVNCSCGYSLAGLIVGRAPESEELRCPECGQCTRLTRTLWRRLIAAKYGRSTP